MEQPAPPTEPGTRGIIPTRIHPDLSGDAPHLHQCRRFDTRIGIIPGSGLLDDFALRPLDATETNDFYELVVERHRRKATIVSSNRSPEWLSMTTDALLAQSAIDWLTSSAHTLVIEGPPYRQRTRLGMAWLTVQKARSMLDATFGWSHARGNEVVPSP